MLTIRYLIKFLTIAVRARSYEWISMSRKQSAVHSDYRNKKRDTGRGAVSLDVEWRPQPDLNRCCPAWNAGHSAPLRLKCPGHIGCNSVYFPRYGTRCRWGYVDDDSAIGRPSLQLAMFSTYGSNFKMNAFAFLQMGDNFE